MENLNPLTSYSSTEPIDSHRDLNRTIPRSELQRICQSESLLIQKITEFNHKGISEIQNQKYEQALIYLSEAQNILEYAASCGKSIQTALIIGTLKNSACAYQKLWELGIASDYTEGILININRSLSISNQARKNRDSQSNHKSKKQKITLQPYLQNKSINSQLYKKSIQNKNLNLLKNAGLHSLQYSALLSQIQKHDDAKLAVINSITHFNSLFSILLQQQKSLKQKNSSLLLTLHKLTQTKNKSLSYQIKDNIFRQALEGVKNLENHRYFLTFDENSIKNFSISQVMQIMPQQIQKQILQNSISVEHYISQESLMYLAIYISCCYFALATEIRLINNSISLPQYQKFTHQYNLSKKYHLLSIYIYTTLVLCQSNYLRHIIQSFKTNYNVDLRDTAINSSYQLTIENFHSKQAPKFSQISSIDIESTKNIKQIEVLIGDYSQQKLKLQKYQETCSSKKHKTKNEHGSRINTQNKQNICISKLQVGMIKNIDRSQEQNEGKNISQFILFPMQTKRNGHKKSVQKSRKKSKSTKRLEKVRSADNFHAKKLQLYQNKEKKNPEKSKKNINKSSKRSKQKISRHIKIREEYLTQKKSRNLKNKLSGDPTRKNSMNKLKLSSCKTNPNIAKIHNRSHQKYTNKQLQE